MVDCLGRDIYYLRLSVTQNCNMNCIYCGKSFDDFNKRLSVSDIEFVMKYFAQNGIRKVRITGGEPLTRPDIADIVSVVSKTDGITDVPMTTNGVGLSDRVKDLKRAGLTRLNISLDTLDSAQFKYITGLSMLNDVLNSIDLAITENIPVKINVVLVKGVNDDQIENFLNMTRELPLDVRFIELMSIGEFGEKNADKIVYNDEIITKFYKLKLVKANLDGVATIYKIDGHKGRVGFISPMGHKFCNLCNRIRLTSDGVLRPCLGDNDERDIFEMITRRDEVFVAQTINDVIFEKPLGHNFHDDFHSKRTMNKIGG